MKSVDVLTAALLIIGGINWGLVGLFQFDLVATIFGSQSALLSRVVYILVGISALYQALTWKTIQKRWGLTSSGA